MTILLWPGALAAWAFIVIWALDGWTRPGYRPLRHPVSALALGPRGWLQATNFVVCGAVITAAAIPLATALGSAVLAVVVGVFGLSLLASGIFPMDPMRGYPPGAPEGTPAETSRRHALHDWAGMVVFGSLPLAAVIAAFALPGVGWTAYSALTAVAATCGFLAFGQAWERDHPHTGLVQRLTILVGWSWLGALFAHAAGQG